VDLHACHNDKATTESERKTKIIVKHNFNDLNKDPCGILILLQSGIFQVRLPIPKQYFKA